MQKYYYVKRTNSFRRRKNPLPVFFSFLIVIILLSTSIVYLFRIHKEPEKKVLATESSSIAEPTVEPTPTIAPPDNSALSTVILKELEGTTALYSVVIKNFKTGQEYYLNEHKRFTSASLYKLWVMAKTYELIHDGDLEEDAVLAGDVVSLNKSFGNSSGSATLKEGSLKFDIQEGLRRMITFSDNYAALLLTRKIKLASILPYLQRNGFSETNISSKVSLPYTTSYDVAQFFEKLYKGSLADEEYTKKMIDLLKAQTLNKKLPKNLPSDVIIAHKTGELDEYSHDAGIVYTPKGDYLIVVLSKSNAPNLANNRIANISEAVYKFFISQ